MVRFISSTTEYISLTAVPATACHPLEGTDKLLLGCLVQYEAEEMECRTLCLWDEGGVNVSNMERFSIISWSRGVDVGGRTLSHDI